MIPAGSLVRWNPPDVSRIFCEDTAIRFAEKMPLPSILRADYALKIVALAGGAS